MLTPDDIDRKTFSTTKFREGYDQAQVDAFLSRASEALRAHETQRRFISSAPQKPALTPADVHDVRFSPTKFRQGYDQGQVDDFLDELALALTRAGEGG